MQERTARLVQEAYAPVMAHMRARYPGIIDAAYEYFFEEEYPEEFLSGLALELSFVNFEDWFVCDFVTSDGKKIIDVYLQDTGAPETAPLRAMKESVLSFYEIKAAGEGRVELFDFLLNESFSAVPPFEGARAGNVFAARFPALAGERVMGPALYPFPQEMKETVRDTLNSLFIRYKKKNPAGSTRDFLKDEAYSFNMVWMSNLYRRTGAGGTE